MEKHDNITMQLIANRLEAMHGDVNDLRGSMHETLKEISSAVNKLVALESNQAAMNQSYLRLEKQLEKAEQKFDKLEERVDSLEKDQPDNKRVVGYIYKALWGAALVVAGFVAKFVGLY